MLASGILKSSPDRILALIIFLSFAVRLSVFTLLQQYDPEYLYSGSLTESYLFPRQATQPWQIDWSYGPLTYVVYWLIVQTPFSSLLARAVNFLADTASIYLVAVISWRLASKSRGLVAAACWAFAPPVVWAAVFGTVDPLPILATLAAIHSVLVGRVKGALLLVGLGFALKWYPILILPLILRAYVPRRNLLWLIVAAISPFLITGLLYAVVPFISNISFNDALALTLRNFSSRIPAGPSIWSLLQVLTPANSISKAVLVLASYSALVVTLVLGGMKGSVGSDIQFFSSSTIMIFSIVNLASQIQGNYLLWYYPLMLPLIMWEPIRPLLLAKLSLLAAGHIFDFIFIYPRLSTIAQGPNALVAAPTAYDILLITAYQLSAWTLLYVLIRRKSLLRIVGALSRHLASLTGR